MTTPYLQAIIEAGQEPPTRNHLPANGINLDGLIANALSRAHQALKKHSKRDDAFELCTQKLDRELHAYAMRRVMASELPHDTGLDLKAFDRQTETLRKDCKQSMPLVYTIDDAQCEAVMMAMDRQIASQHTVSASRNGHNGQSRNGVHR